MYLFCILISGGVIVFYLNEVVSSTCDDTRGNGLIVTHRIGGDRFVVKIHFLKHFFGESVFAFFFIIVGFWGLCGDLHAVRTACFMGTHGNSKDLIADVFTI